MMPETWAPFTGAGFGEGVVICNGAGCIVRIHLPGRVPAGVTRPMGPAITDPTAPAVVAADRLARLFATGDSVHDLPVVLPNPGAFAGRALQACQTIPRGETRTYAWLARAAGSPGAVRAAGTAMARNPVPLVIPCHRVVPSGAAGDGLGNFGGGVAMKRWLLEREGALAADAGFL